MPTGDVADGIDHRHDRQAEGERDTEKADPEVRKGGRQDCRAAAAENEPKGAEEFGCRRPYQIVGHSAPPCSRGIRTQRHACRRVAVLVMDRRYRSPRPRALMPRKTSRVYSAAPWPGLPRPPTSSGETIIEILPQRVIAMDQLHLPRTAPVFDVHLALLGKQNIIVPFGVDEPFQTIFLGEAVGHALAMLPCAPR